MAEIKDSSQREIKYTQRQWDRVVGWGSVPEEYKYVPSSDNGVSKDVSDEHEKDKQ